MVEPDQGRRLATGLSLGALGIDLQKMAVVAGTQGPRRRTSAIERNTDIPEVSCNVS